MGYQEFVCHSKITRKTTADYLLHSAWFFFKLMNVSGAEAVIAAASPFVGQVGRTSFVQTSLAHTKLSREKVPALSAHMLIVRGTSAL